jgi:hypothetical protein
LPDRVFGPLMDQQMRVRPAKGLARVEEVAVNPILTTGRQVLDDGWMARLDAPRPDVGTGMTEDEVVELTVRADVDAVRPRILRPLVAALLLASLAVTAGPSVGQERLVSKQDADRIFGLTRSQWEAEARRMVDSRTWKPWPGSGDQGTGVMATDPRTGVGLAVRPSFGDGQGPPETLVVGSYYPVGTFRRFSDQTRREMEAVTGSDFGPGYSVSVSFSSTASPSPGFDVVEVVITRSRR